MAQQNESVTNILKAGAIIIGSAVGGGLLGKFLGKNKMRKNPMESVTLEEFFGDFVQDDIYVSHHYINDILLDGGYDSDKPDKKYIGSVGVAELILDSDQYLENAYINDDGNVVLCAGECFKITNLDPDDERLNNSYGDLNPSIPYYVPVKYKGDGSFKQIQDHGNAIMATTSKRKAIKEAKKYRKDK